MALGDHSERLWTLRDRIDEEGRRLRRSRSIRFASLVGFRAGPTSADLPQLSLIKEFLRLALRCRLTPRCSGR